MTIGLLVINVLDYALVEYFNLNLPQLHTDDKIQTLDYSQEVPYTPEVWATVVAGLLIDEHGVKHSSPSQWSHQLPEFASRFTGHLDEHIRYRLGQLVTNGTNVDWGFGTTSLETMFAREEEYLHNWPSMDNSDVDGVNASHYQPLDGKRVASTDNTVPSDVVNVRERVEFRQGRKKRRGDPMDVPDEQLRDVGYIS